MNKLSKRCIKAYEEKYPFDWIGYMEPSDIIGIESKEYSLQQPDDETDESFMARLDKCTEDNNLFVKEWPEDIMSMDPDIEY